ATASGFGGLPAPDPATATERLATVLGAVAATGAEPAVHCCAAAPPVGLLVDAGARGISLDATLLTWRDDDPLGEAVEAGIQLLLGMVPSVDPAVPPSTRRLVAPVQQLWQRLGFAGGRLTEAVVVTPTCGLAGASPAWARQALSTLRACAEALVEDPDASLPEERRPRVLR
ncbi:MAG: methionine synthase, partial [Actinomycetota bacterium]|nr:methionine synthase [Actinomycetota bacterium]